ncbi:MAG: T9SS type A sorting domain-containing protein [Candidatus Marinimicrobia bacterium]|nr:T9SS type A sorting domain-containing protein [Candidatus Neomarinimicrobiota bacterium]
MPPIISDVSQFSDTFDKRKNITAKIIELENQTVTPLLNYKYHGNDTWLSKSMTNVLEDTFSVTLDANPGDSVYYFISAEDETGLRVESNVNCYVVLAPPQERTVLVIRDNSWALDSLYTQAFDSVGCSYLLWDVGVHRGIDSSVIHYPQFSMIAIFGCRSKIVPLLDSTSADPCNFRKYMQNGGGLMLADMDYFYGWGMPTSGRFSNGDFAYDYFGIGTYENDPDDSISIAGGTADIEMSGVAEDSLTDAFSLTNNYGPLQFDLIGGKSENWSDYIVPENDGISIFKGSKSNKDMAIRKENGNFRTVFFTFPVELSNSFEFRSLMQNAVQWLEDRPVKIEPERAIASKIELLTNFPNPFNASTRIRYRIVSEGSVHISIYDLKGSLVKTLVNVHQSTGLYEMDWNGTDRFGQSVASGVYFLRIESDHSTRNRKILLVR